MSKQRAAGKLLPKPNAHYRRTTMAQKRYVPVSDAQYNEWLMQLANELQAIGATYGFTPAEIDALKNAQQAWRTDYTNHLNAQNAARAARQAKARRRRESERLARTYVQRLQRHPAMTDAVRRRLRITVPDREPSPITAPATAPLGEVDTSLRLTHRLYFWHEDAKGARRGKPTGATACEVWRKVGGAPPADLNECEFVGAPSRSPYPIAYTGETAGQTVHYILRWRTARGEVGPISETLSATVTG
ncbi:MAG: hypothetical protein NZM10_07665 [Fimbriimonadales bacterium]|nr:hypothetical protein [Fimbriimonadales bacterium]